ncbi:MAG TPA: hypothetical protein VKX16_13075 [Chloroflexota bacterium]|nr:hypothetical protein [Chloroflexota bacterium]
MRIQATEQELLVQEIAALGTVLRNPETRARYADLRAAIEAGDVPDELLGHLGNVLELGLQSGRLRKLYGADGEQALAHVFRRTPPGASLSEAASEVTKALSGIRGQTVEDITVSALGPGSYGVTIDTDRCQLTMRLDRAGVRIENVAIGL